MSRFEEVINEAIGEVVLQRVDVQGRDARRAHRAARPRPPGRAPRRGRRSRRASRSTSRLPRLGIQTQELYTLHGSAICVELGTRRLIGVTAQGITRVPVRAGAGRQRGARAPHGPRASTTTQIAQILEAVPVATHNQRGLGTLHVGCTELCDDEIDAWTLLEIVEQSMSSEIYELMKRSDEALRRREGPPPPAVRRGLRAGDDPRRGRRASPRSTTARSSRRARSTSRRSTSTTSSPSGSGRSARSAASSTPGSLEYPDQPRRAAGSGSVSRRGRIVALAPLVVEQPASQPEEVVGARTAR